WEARTDGGPAARVEGAGAAEAGGVESSAARGAVGCVRELPEPDRERPTTAAGGGAGEARADVRGGSAQFWWGRRCSVGVGVDGGVLGPVVRVERVGGVGRAGAGCEQPGGGACGVDAVPRVRGRAGVRGLAGVAAFRRGGAGAGGALAGAVGG